MSDMTAVNSAILVLLVTIAGACFASWWLVRRSIVGHVRNAIEAAEACSQQLTRTASVLAEESQQIAGSAAAQAIAANKESSSAAMTTAARATPLADTTGAPVPMRSRPPFCADSHSILQAL